MGLGYINHDLTLMKNFSLGNGRNLQVRAEMYNAFNTTQYQGVNTQRDVRLRDRRADEPGVRLDQRRARQLEPRDPARRPAHVLTVTHTSSLLKPARRHVSNVAPAPVKSHFLIDELGSNG